MNKTLSVLFIVLLLPWLCGAEPLHLMHGFSYDGQEDVRGWWMSEKLDGVRAYWDGKQLLSRNGHVFHAPDYFLVNLPDFPIEGELWAGRRRFQKTVSVVKKQAPHDGWKQIKFALFDAPTIDGGFEQRIAVMQQWFAAHPSSFAFVIEQRRVANHASLEQELARIEKLGGEGLMLRRPGSLYVGKRNNNVLKVKSFSDMEAVVVGHTEGKGKYQGMLGALVVEFPDGLRFKVGSGFSDQQRRKPPRIGQTITFKYQDFLESGKPRFPVFLRVRENL